ncbi:hypothetical protein BFL34_00850 [Clavibacter michiganensis]|uniref:Secreted protein n=1 Tax=Clavibacter michiganensis TaxID=28447 RepID=A0A251YB58_9MICO|nr:hypothetical protein BFL34_00850 [Clavibacter michiganensis]
MRRPANLCFCLVSFRLTFFLTNSVANFEECTMGNHQLDRMTNDRVWGGRVAVRKFENPRDEFRNNHARLALLQRAACLRFKSNLSNALSDFKGIIQIPKHVVVEPDGIKRVTVSS